MGSGSASRLCTLSSPLSNVLLEPSAPGPLTREGRTDRAPASLDLNGIITFLQSETELPDHRMASSEMIIAKKKFQRLGCPHLHSERRALISPTCISSFQHLWSLCLPSSFLVKPTANIGAAGSSGQSGCRLFPSPGLLWEVPSIACWTSMVPGSWLWWRE